MEAHFLGTAGGVPSPDRSLPCSALRVNGRTVLFDCGEGSQRQLMISSLSLMSVDVLLLSHHHGDHVTGIPGMLQTMGLFSRGRGLSIMGPAGTSELIGGMMSTYGEELFYGLEVRDLEDGDSFFFEHAQVTAVATEHSAPSLGYVVREPLRPGRFLPEKAKALGVPEGPLFSRLQRGEAVEAGGRRVGPDDVMGPPRPGRSMAYSGDTAPSGRFAAAADDVDLMVHEATFPAAMAHRAEESRHSTAAQAAAIARDAGAHFLVLNHISARVEDEAAHMREAAEVIGAARVAVARDFDRMSIHHRD